MNCFYSFWITHCFLLFISLILSTQSQQCPSRCNCLGDVIECRGKGLLEIPDDLINFDWVATIDLSENQISHVDPFLFRGLNKLKNLDLTRNAIKSIDGKLFEYLPNLKSLKLGFNQLHDWPRIQQDHTQLKSLWLNHNDLRSVNKEFLSHLPILRTLDLSSNQIGNILKDNFPPNLSKSLFHLNLSNNTLSILIPGSLNNLSSLQHLRLNKNRIQRLIRTRDENTFSECRNLKSLELNRNRLSTIESLTFNNLEKLKVLKLRKNNITRIEDGAFHGLTSLDELQMDLNELKELSGDRFYGLFSLKRLSLSFNAILRISDNSQLADFIPKLEELDLRDNDLESISSRAFAGLSKLRRLWLDHNRISSISAEAFRQLNNLWELGLTFNRLSWNLEDISRGSAFSGLKKLSKLRLDNNKIKTLVKRSFSGLDHLRHLHLADNAISSIHRDAFSELKELRDLRMNSTHLVCDCQLAWLPSWLLGNGFNKSVRATCAYPSELKGRSIFTLTPKDFICNNSPTPKIIEHPTSAVGLVGKNLYLRCRAISSASAPADVKVEWKHNDKNLPSSSFSWHSSEDTITGDTTYNSTLSLTNLQKSRHQGTFQCSISNQFGRAYSKKANISVAVYPRFQDRPENLEVPVGSQARLKCCAEGSPPPTVAWQKDGGDGFPAARDQRMHLEPHGCSFVIMRVKEEDAGVYSCRAYNVAGNITATATLTVLGPPRFLMPLTDVHADRGSRVVLKCNGTGSPRPSITWFREGIRISNAMTLLPEKKVQVNNDGDDPRSKIGYKNGNVSHNGHSSSSSSLADDFASPINDVAAKRERQISGGHDKSDNSDDGGRFGGLLSKQQQQRISSSYVFSHDNSILSIINAQPGDSGLYTCVLTNVLDTKQQSLTLQVGRYLVKPIPVVPNYSVLSDSTAMTPIVRDDDENEDENTTITVGMIIIAVVCCVVATSLVWVAIIYKTRRNARLRAAAAAQQGSMTMMNGDLLKKKKNKKRKDDNSTFNTSDGSGSFLSSLKKKNKRSKSRTKSTSDVETVLVDPDILGGVRGFNNLDISGGDNSLSSNGRSRMYGDGTLGRYGTINSSIKTDENHSRNNNRMYASSFVRPSLPPFYNATQDDSSILTSNMSGINDIPLTIHRAGSFQQNMNSVGTMSSSVHTNPMSTTDGSKIDTDATEVITRMINESLKQAAAAGGNFQDAARVFEESLRRQQRLRSLPNIAALSTGKYNIQQQQQRPSNQHTAMDYNMPKNDFFTMSSNDDTDPNSSFNNNVNYNYDNMHSAVCDTMISSDVATTIDSRVATGKTDNDIINTSSSYYVPSIVNIPSNSFHDHHHEIPRVSNINKLSHNPEAIMFTSLTNDSSSYRTGYPQPHTSLMAQSFPLPPFLQNSNSTHDNLEPGVMTCCSSTIFTNPSMLPHVNSNTSTSINNFVNNSSSSTGNIRNNNDKTTSCASVVGTAPVLPTSLSPHLGAASLLYHQQPIPSTSTSSSSQFSRVGAIHQSLRNAPGQRFQRGKNICPQPFAPTPSYQMMNNDPAILRSSIKNLPMFSSQPKLSHLVNNNSSTGNRHPILSTFKRQPNSNNNYLPSSNGPHPYSIPKLPRALAIVPPIGGRLTHSTVARRQRELEILQEELERKKRFLSDEQQNRSYRQQKPLKEKSSSHISNINSDNNLTSPTMESNTSSPGLISIEQHQSGIMSGEDTRKEVTCNQQNSSIPNTEEANNSGSSSTSADTANGGSLIDDDDENEIKSINRYSSTDSSSGENLVNSQRDKLSSSADNDRITSSQMSNGNNKDDCLNNTETLHNNNNNTTSVGCYDSGCHADVDSSDDEDMNGGSVLSLLLLKKEQQHKQQCLRNDEDFPSVDDHPIRKKNPSEGCLLEDVADNNQIMLSCDPSDSNDYNPSDIPPSGERAGDNYESYDTGLIMSDCTLPRTNFELSSSINNDDDLPSSHTQSSSLMMPSNNSHNKGAINNFHNQQRLPPFNENDDDMVTRSMSASRHSNSIGYNQSPQNKHNYVNLPDSSSSVIRNNGSYFPHSHIDGHMINNDEISCCSADKNQNIYHNYYNDDSTTLISQRQQQEPYWKSNQFITNEQPSMNFLPNGFVRNNSVENIVESELI